MKNILQKIKNKGISNRLTDLFLMKKHKDQESKIPSYAQAERVADIANRVDFEKIVGNKLAEEEQGCLLLLDVDQLKEVNDSYSYDMGDAVIRNVAAILKRSFRQGDCTVRLESDEFAVWLTELSQGNAAEIRQWIASVNDRLLHPGDGIPAVSVSVGAAFSEVGDDYKSLYKKANGALYRVKVGGRCGFEVQQGRPPL